MAEPVSIKIFDTLKNLLDMYEYKKEEILVLEAIANGIDAKSTTVDINFEQNASGHYVTFLNNGPPMKQTDFENYHTISSSTKTKGDGIGFAGVGAKIFLAAWEQAEIITITGKNNRFFVSRMFRRGKNVEYDSSLHGIPVQQIIGNKRLVHKYGTSYKVRMNTSGYNWLLNNIREKLQFWFNLALISKKLVIRVDGKIIKPWQPSGQKICMTLSYKKQPIPCYIWISKEDIPEGLRHIVYYVFGKRIKNESVDWAVQIKGNNSKKVFCMADVSILAQHLVANKENFKKNFYTNKIRSLVRKAFFDKLDQEGLIFKHKDMAAKTDIVVNELTRRLDRALQTPELKFLNPFSNPRDHDVTIKNKGGDRRIEATNGRQTPPNAIQDSNDSNGRSGEPSDHKPRKNYHDNDDGNESGTTKTKRTRGIYIIPENFPNDSREGWLDMRNRAVVYNTGHPFSKSVENNPSLHDYNLTRVVISSLIKAKNDQVEMDAITALRYFERILHDVWI